MNKKLILFLLLALLLPATATAHDFEVDGIYYTINGNEATVTYKGSPAYEYDEYSGSVTIPSTVTYGSTTYSVTSIGNSAFSSCSGLTSINIPNSVTSIGGSAFSRCSGLTSINIPNSVTSIGSHAFNDTPWYNNQPDGLVYAGLVAYKYKGNMPIGTSITFAEGTLGIAGNAFSGCSGLASIEIPNSVTAIGFFAFNGCTGLTNIDIPNSVTSIGDAVFQGCYNLTSVSIPNSVTAIGDFAFSGCSGLASIEIPNSVTAIGDYAFSGCSGLACIEIPNSVTAIGGWAFYDTPWFNNQPDGLVYAGLVAYKYKGTMPEGTNIILREGTLGISDYAFSGCSGLTSIDIPNSVTSIGDGAFYQCSGLTSINIGNSVTSIGDAAFYSCSGLTSINIPNSVITIYDLAFCDCFGLTNLTIGNSVTSIGERAFSGCWGLTSVTLPNSVTSIGDGAFSSCYGLTSIDIPNSITSISEFAFDGCGLTSLTIPNSVTSIGEFAFASCYYLTSINIPKSVTSIGNRAFAGCFGLTEIYSWGVTLPTIDSYTFDECYGATLYVPEFAMGNYQEAEYWKDFTNIDAIRFKTDDIYYRVLDESTASVIANNNEGALYCGDVVIPDSVSFKGIYPFAVTAIDNNAFNDCYELTSIVIPNTVESIGEQAFQGCTGLTSVTIGSGVTLIGAKAFNYCNALATVKCLGTVPPVMASSDCFSTAAYNRARLIVPRLFIESYQAADYWYKFANIDGWGSSGPGDVDGDGNVTIKDATDMIDVMLGGGSEDFYFDSSDFNNNGRVDIADVVTLIDYLLNGYY